MDMLNEIRTFATAWYNLPFTVALLAFLCLSILQVMGLDHDPDADIDIDADANLDYDADTNVDADTDQQPVWCCRITAIFGRWPYSRHNGAVAVVG